MSQTLLLLSSFEGIDEVKFLDVFKESSLENAPEWYPELTPAEALHRYESSFLEYMRGPFWDEGGLQALLQDETGYRCALRLYPQAGKNRYFIEALETRPDSRRQGYAKTLLCNLIKRLECQYGKIELISNPHKTNLASIATHLSSGFTRELEYFLEDGVKNDRMVTMIYHTV